MSQKNKPMSDDYGVKYIPLDALPPPLYVHDLSDIGIRYIRLQWVDLINNVRYRVIDLSYFNKLLASARPGISLTKASLGLVFLTLAPGFSAAGEYVYAPDLSTLRRCPYAPGHASVMGWFQEKNGPSMEVDLCPRTILRRVVE
jgi:glutamine synthetase